jgi:hypothetical protein
VAEPLSEKIRGIARKYTGIHQFLICGLGLAAAVESTEVIRHLPDNPPLQQPHCGLPIKLFLPARAEQAGDGNDGDQFERECPH